MEENKVFTYNYSAERQNEAEHIRRKYLPKEESKMDVLRRLDRRAKRAGVIEALVMGVVGCLIFGIGMCFGLDVFAGADIYTLIFMAIGIAVMLPAYSVYKRISGKTREALTPEILRLSEEMMNN